MHPFINAVRTLRSRFWAYYLRKKGATVGRGFQAHGPIEILLRDGASLSNLRIGDNVTFQGRVYLRMRKNGAITLDSGVTILPEVWLTAANEAEFFVGENTYLGAYSIFNGGHGIRIGSNCIFGGLVYFNTSDHAAARGSLIKSQGFIGAPIHLGDDVWIGGQVFVNKGVSIGTGCVIGSGAVVTKDIPEYKIAAGNPARVLKDRE